MSETMTVAVKLRAGEALTKAVECLKGTIIGEGEHELFAGKESGYAFQLPGWMYPCVIRNNGTLAFDNYHGEWGSIDALHDLQQEYSLQTAEAQAQTMGLYYEREGNHHVTVFFGEERTVVIDWAGNVEAYGFGGVGCDTACEAFAAALGQTLTVNHKQEYYQEKAKILESGG